MANENLKYLNSGNFKTVIAQGITLVDFYADWCGPCRRIAPVIEELANEMGAKAVVAKLDIEQAQDIAAEYQVMSIPTLILFKNGQEIKRIVGLTDKDSLKNLINSAL